MDCCSSSQRSQDVPGLFHAFVGCDIVAGADRGGWLFNISDPHRRRRVISGCKSCYGCYHPFHLTFSLCLKGDTSGKPISRELPQRRMEPVLPV